TLSPALSAILLRPRQKGHFEALPWFAFVPIGAWLGHKIGLHTASATLAALGLRGGEFGESVEFGDLLVTPAMVDALRAWGPIVLGALAGLVAALAFGRGIN